jgi:hypothetical protein
MFTLGVLAPGRSEATAADLLAASFFPPNNDDPQNLDPDPTLSGVFRIDSTTGAATPFISAGTAGLIDPSHLAIGPHDGHLYVSSNASGQIYVFDSQTGAPIDDPVRNIQQGAWINLGAGVGVAALLFDSTGILYASASPAADPSLGFIARLDSVSGDLLGNALDLIDTPGGMVFAPDGALLVDEGNLFGLGSIVRVEQAMATPLIPNDTFEFVNSQALLLAPLPGDFDRNAMADGGDLLRWQRARGSLATPPGTDSDADGDGQVTQADREVWEDHFGELADLLVGDFFGAITVENVKANPILRYKIDGQDPELFALVPPHVPEELPPGAFVGSNFPSDMLLTSTGTVLVSTLGLTRRPDNRGALYEYDAAGNLLRTIAEGLPPISSIVLAPEASLAGRSIPEPGSGLLAGCCLCGLSAAGRRRAAGKPAIGDHPPDCT